MASQARTIFSLCVFFLCCLFIGVDGKIRRYYIAANEVEWNYGPSGLNVVHEEPLETDHESAPYFETGPNRIGGTYIKALYQEYTDESFTERIVAPDHHGFLGPILWTEVGDTIEIVFQNNARFPFSMNPHTIFYTQDNEGAAFIGGAENRRSAVPPGESVMYTWYVPGRAAPTENEWSSTFYPYFSHVHPASDINAGLIGGIVVTRAGKAREDGHPVDVDREFFTMYSVIEESASPYIDVNIAKYLGEDRVDDEDLRDEDFDGSNGMAVVNGLMFANIPGYEMVAGERIRWYIYSVGSERDVHSAHWHGQTLVTSFGHRIDILPIFPHVPAVADMYPDDVGTWFYHCHVNAHLVGGMSAFFTVHPAQDQYAYARNFATTYDPFAYIIQSYRDYEPFLPELPGNPLDPFTSSASRIATCFIVILLAFCTMI